MTKADPWAQRKKLSVAIEEAARELAGPPCLELDRQDSNTLGYRRPSEPGKPNQNAVNFLLRRSKTWIAHNDNVQKPIGP